MIVLRRFLLLIAAALLVWRIGTSGMSAHYAKRLAEGEDNAAGKALAWDRRQPEALHRQAVALRDEDPAAAAALLIKAYAQNPADGRPLMVMAEIAREGGDQERADALVRTAVQLMPADPRVQKQAARYWTSRGDLQQAMQHWSAALETDPETKQELFPLLLRLAEDPHTRLAYRPFTVSPPSWWEAFFSEVAKRAQATDTVRLLYTLRSESPQAPITEAERRSYVARLMKDGLIVQAYIDWINGLTREQRVQLGLLHDGGFELEPDNWGFGWYMRTERGALVDRAHTYGSDGDKSLHLLFERHEGRFAGVSQALFLDPGLYRLTGRVRTDSLETKGGLKWVVRCLMPEAEDLGESERFLGANQWRDFRLDFQVPQSCVFQEIRLVSAGRRSFEHQLTGGAWFDRMAIRKAPHLAEVPEIEPESVADATGRAPDAPAPPKVETAPGPAGEGSAPGAEDAR